MCEINKLCKTKNLADANGRTYVYKLKAKWYRSEQQCSFSGSVFCNFLFLFALRFSTLCSVPYDESTV